LGAAVKTGQVLGTVSDPFGENEQEIVAPKAGHVIGGMEKPLVNEGDALYHIASADEKELRSVDIIQTVVDIGPDSSVAMPGEEFHGDSTETPA